MPRIWFNSASLFMTVSEFAKAKVNLTLDVLGKRPDGYHELLSLVVFAKDFGDTLTLRPGGEFRLTLSGPTAQAVEGVNLVEKANAQFADALGAEARTGSFHLEKHIPVAAGLGGGSADAAAAIRALVGINPGHGLSEPQLNAMARAVGADVPACLVQAPLVMAGVGERILLLPMALDIPAVLVNPGVKLSTRLVFEALDAAPLLAQDGDKGPTEINLSHVRDTQGLRAFVLAGRNDLEPPARRVAPVIGQVIEALSSTEGCWLARLSGSGPTCFGLYGSHAEAAAAFAALAASHPGWWVRQTTLG